VEQGIQSDEQVEVEPVQLHEEVVFSPGGGAFRPNIKLLAAL
jgi:hypothetical protein